jgi:hypothetical protein
LANYFCQFIVGHVMVLVVLVVLVVMEVCKSA